MILDIIALAITSSISVFLLILLLMQRKAKLNLLEKYVRSEIEKSIIIEKLEEVTKENELKSIEGSDGFLKFVSDSRDWAFKYIEDVQNALIQFDVAIATELEYADKYGILDTNSPSKDAIARVSLAYKELKKILPEDMIK
jgi:hypothetical protein